MRDDIEEISLADYRRLTAKLPRKRAKRPPRLDIPRATDVPRDGLTGLIARGWSTRTRNGGAEHQLYQGWGLRLETGWHASQSDACAEAKALERSSLPLARRAVGVGG